MTLARVLFLVTTVSALAASTQQTGLIAGRLVTHDTGAPIRGARVTLAGGDGAGGKVVTSDNRGGFVFGGLGPGRYDLSASRLGFVDVKYGEKRPGSGRLGTPIVLTEGQRINNLTVVMPRAGALSGIVLDEFGEPALGAQVRAMRYVWMSGKRTLMPAGVALVDDLGAYRIFALPPGEYIVSAVAKAVDRSPAADVEMRAAILMVQAQAAQRAAAAGNPPPTPITPLPQPERIPTSGYVATFYPGTTALSSAATITLGASEQRAGLDIQLQRVPLARVSGVVRDLDGSVPRAEVLLIPALATTATLPAEVSSTNSALDAAGRFALNSISPGQYSLVVRSRRVPGDSTATMRWAMLDVAVNGSNIDELSLTLQRGLAVSGTIVGDAATRPPIAAHASVFFMPVGDVRGLAELAGLQAAPITDGFFATNDLVPGRYQVTVTPSPPGWRLASAVFGDTDVLDFPLEAKPGSGIPPGVLTFTTRETEVSGTLFDGRNEPGRDCTVVIFAADERYWVPESRRMQALRPDTTGRFVFKNLPPGTYRLAAADDLDPARGVDPAVLRELAAAPTILITLADGERKTQDVRIR